MHYSINDNIIKSECAAKSTVQTNKIVLNIISSLPQQFLVLDYGCGKLRYSIPLCKQVHKVIAIDSNVQINKKQVINGIMTTVDDYSKNYLSNLIIYDLSSVEWKKMRYNFIICANVLSAIPSYKERINVLRNIRDMLLPEGKALITVQYRNSYFKSYSKRNNSTKYYDGWIINNNNNFSFYGLINPESLKELCLEVGLKILEIKLIDGSAFFTVNYKQEDV